MDKRQMILRTGLPERLCHWFLVVCFFLVGLSGLAWLFPSLSWLSGVLGGPQLARLLHPILGIVVFVLLCFMFLRFWRYNTFEQEDRLWFRNVKGVLLNRPGERLYIGKYNAGQKVLFWLIMAAIVVLLATGLVIWRRYFSDFFPIGVVRWSLLLHSAAGIGLMLLIIGHIHLAIMVRGSIRGMLYGKVSRAWARRHHDRWHDELEEAGEFERGRPERNG